jgi:hypothetical protein
MEKIYCYISKKPYQKPAIEEFILDREMSLVMDSPPVEPPDEPPPLGIAPEPLGTETTYKQTVEYPLGGSRPVY